MAGSALNIIREGIRETLTGDTKFYKKPVYFFELVVPIEIGITDTSFLFPLALNPQDISMEEPFSIEAQPTQGGGLYVEENGIVQRMIKIRGHTGFKPRKLEASFGLGFLTAPEKRSYGRNISPIIPDLLSGQRHFQWLQDKVFRTYADLKRDPATSEGTSMIWHNQKDDEHWLVAPQVFSLTRSGSRPTLYEYNIELLVLDRADAKSLTLTEDKGILDQIKDVARQIQGYVDLATGALQDLSAIAGEIRSTIAAIDQIIDSVGQLVSAAQDFVNGVTALINAPFALVQSAIDVIDETNEFIQDVRELGTAINSFPENVTQSFRQLGDALEGLGSYPSAYQKPADRYLQEIQDRNNPFKNLLSKESREDELSNAPTTLEGMRNLGTGLMPGDASRSKAMEAQAAGKEIAQYQSVKEHKVQQGDTLQNLAARFLGDARLWKHIAVVNGIKPPFITDMAVRDLNGGQPLPGTLGRGQALLIPSKGKPPAAQPILATYGVQPDESNEVHLLGTDLRLDPDPVSHLYDLSIDLEGGSVDVRTTKGIPNLQQGIRTRLLTERGHDVMYQQLGVDRIVGLGNRFIDIETAKFRVVEAVTTDPRVAGLQTISFENPGDALEVDMRVEVRGFAEPVQIPVSVRT